MRAPGGRALDPDTRAELEDQRGFLLRSLEDLEAERAAGELSEDDYQSLHDDYTARAAEVLRAIDEGQAAPAAPPSPGAPRGRRLLAVVVVAALAGSAGLALVGASGTRMAGDTITGNTPEGPAGVDPGPDQDPLARAADLARGGQVSEALQLYDDVLAGEPDNIEALSERGLLLVSLASATERPGLAAQGRASIEAALTLDDDNPRALFYLGLALRLEGDDERAADAFTAALAADPPPALRSAMEDFLASIATAEPGPAAPPSPTSTP